nr:TIGR03619 family F420-dependent LLM class oxidoreductase [Kineosporia mesophila]
MTTDIASAARGFEDIGYDSVWAFERLLVPGDQSGPHGLYGAPGLPWPAAYRNIPEALTVLTVAGAVTSRVELGTNVLIAPLHLPTRLAKTIASLDHISGGRVIAGVGTGWSIDEYSAAAPRPIEERGDALEEFLDVAQAIWGPDPVEFHNERYDIAPANLGPKPARKIPVVLAGTTGKALDRISRRGDGWIPVAGPAAETGAGLARIRERAAEYGRDPQSVGCVAQLIVSSFERVTTAERAPYTGDFEQIAEDVAALAEVGVEHVYVTAPGASRNLEHLLENAAGFHAAVRAAGV